MTFTELVDEVADRMNLTSDTAIARVGRSVNRCYRQIAVSVGMQTTAIAEATATTTIGSDLLTFGPSPIKVVKLLTVFNDANPRPNALGEVSLLELRSSTMSADPARAYAVYRIEADRVTIKLNSEAATAYVLNADVIRNMVTLSGADVPMFPESFHDALIFGAMAIEYDKMEKPDLAMKKEAKSNEIVSEMRFFIAKSAWRDLYQGKTQFTGQIPLVS